MLVFDPDDLAVATIWGEARGEIYEGMVGVAEVIRNRMKGKFFSDGTVAGTVIRPLQFSCWNTSDPNRIKMLCIQRDEALVKQCRMAWLESLDSDVTNGAVMYHAVSVFPPWASSGEFERTESIGGHIFYRRARAA